MGDMGAILKAVPISANVLARDNNYAMAKMGELVIPAPHENNVEKLLLTMPL
jgi:hypothetical protein